MVRGVILEIKIGEGEDLSRMAEIIRISPRFEVALVKTRIAVDGMMAGEPHSLRGTVNQTLASAALEKKTRTDGHSRISKLWVWRLET